MRRSVPTAMVEPRTEPAPPGAPATRFVLVRPSHAGNVGAVARAMRVMGFDDLVLVEPRDPEVLERDETRARARDAGYVETVFGRRLYLPEINARNMQRRQAAERAAINAPMQGTAADIIKRAMIAVDGWLANADLDAVMIMQVHDELVFEAAEADLEALLAGVRGHMQGAADLDVALLVDCGTGSNWDEAH